MLGPIAFGPASGRRIGRTIKWDLRQFKPKEDVFLQWYEGFADVAIDGRWPWTTDHGYLSQDWHLENLYTRPFKQGIEIWTPVRIAANWLGATLDGDPLKRHATLKRNGISARFTSGSRTLDIAKGSIQLPGKVFVRNHSDRY